MSTETAKIIEFKAGEYYKAVPKSEKEPVECFFYVTEDKVIDLNKDLDEQTVECIYVHKHNNLTSVFLDEDAMIPIALDHYDFSGVVRIEGEEAEKVKATINNYIAEEASKFKQNIEYVMKKRIE